MFHPYSRGFRTFLFWHRLQHHALSEFLELILLQLLINVIISVSIFCLFFDTKPAKITDRCWGQRRRRPYILFHTALQIS